MSNLSAQKRLAEYYNIVKENDHLYRDAARRFGLSECAFWILYVLRTDETVATPSGICDVLYQPKQTIHSALKHLEEKGYIELLHAQGRRGKQILLTAQGIELTQNTVDRVVEAECDALLVLDDEEQKAMVRLFGRYTDALKCRMQPLGKITTKPEREAHGGKTEEFGR